MSKRGDREALGIPMHPRTDETPQQVLERLAARLRCEPRQVADRVLRMLEEMARDQEQLLRGGNKD